MIKDAILIAGPTASGKTEISINLAKQLNGVIINTDSMQVYDILSVITAKPTVEEMGDVEHLLFGHVHPTVDYSTAKWIEDVETVLGEIGNKLPIFVGGTGLYFKALSEGLSQIPDIDPEIRLKWRTFSDQHSSNELYDELELRDMDSAARLNQGDTQRIVRALEVVDSTGKSIHHWQKIGNKTPLLDITASRNYIILPERQRLNQRIDQRFRKMVEEGAIEEVQTLLKLNLSHESPVMRAIGVKQITAYLEGEIKLEEASDLASIASRQYAKRQRTWFRNQFKDNWIIVDDAKALNWHVS